jgi:capsule polysaccharide modification protein KpsS
VDKLLFITPKKEGENLMWVRALKPFLDIEITSNISTIKKSKKNLILWNPYSYVTKSEKHRDWKINLYQYFIKKNKSVYVLERGYLPESLYLDKNGVLFDSSSYNENKWNYSLTQKQLKKVEEFIEEFKMSKKTLERQQSDRINKQDFLEQIGAKKGQKIAFVPLQKANDTVTRKWCGWIKSVTNFKTIIIYLASNQPNTLFLVKSHPLRPDMGLKDSKNIKNVDHLHYKDCIQYSDIIITINSSVGMQAMIWEKPTIILGNAFFSFDDINYQANNLKDLEFLIHTIKNPNMEKVKRFIYYLQYNFYTHCIMRKHPHRPIKVTRVVFDHPITNKKIILEEK